MIVTTLVTFYEQNRKQISDLNRQQCTCVSRTKRTHLRACHPLVCGSSLLVWSEGWQSPS